MARDTLRAMNAASIARAAAAYEAALLGDHSSLASAIDELCAHDDDASKAWAAALRALRALLAPAQAEALDVATLAPLRSAEPGARRVAARACLTELWRCVVSLQVGRVSEASAMVDALVAGDDAPAAASALDLARSAVALFSGDAQESFERAVTASEVAARARLPDTLVGAAVLRALALLSRGELEAATAVARRGARMARAEGLVVQEYTTGLVLARARRYADKPHLATRILAALERVVPSTFGPLLAWERAMAGMSPGASEPAHAVALRDMVDAARSGDRAALMDAYRRATVALQGAAPLVAEAAAVLSALDPDAREIAPLAQAFVSGVEARTPAGFVDADDPSGVTGFVLMRPGLAPRRLLPAGMGLCEAARVPAPRSREARPMMALAALALAGDEGLELDALFECIYGFAYASAKHESLLRVVLHRARTELGELGEITRRADRVTLIAAGPLLVPDPRCARPLETRVLALLASSPGAGAREVAAQVGLPLRTVQLSLRTLVDDGACTVEREGARVAYMVEDTTFGSPTTARLRAPGRALES